MDVQSASISIHALHEESDQPFLASHVIDGEISIHALHEESDTERPFDCWSMTYFNPRSP